MADLDQLEPIIAALGGFAPDFPARAIPYAEQMLAALIRDKAIDEPTWYTVQQWAVHQSEWFALTGKIKTRARIDSKSWMIGEEQKRAYHEKRALELQRELTATPWQRHRAMNTVQTSFFDTLDAALQPPAPDPASNVIGFNKPQGRRA